MEQEIWIDGFNLFYRWDATRDLFARPRNESADMGTIQDTALRRLASGLGKQKRRTLVFMDGGVKLAAETIHGLRVRWPGPGKKADDAMREALERRGENAHSVLAVSSDRALAATLRTYGAKIMTVEKFALEHLRIRTANAKKQNKLFKTHRLSDREVKSWMDYFGEK